jgi:hypothetical protein
MVGGGHVVSRVTQLLQRIALRMSIGWERRRGDGGDAMCNELARNLAEMGPTAAGTPAEPSPGTGQLLARARRRSRREFERLIPTISQGITDSSDPQLAVGAANAATERQRAEFARVQEQVDAHERARPDVPPVLNRLCAYPLTRVAIAALCVAIETVITTPALAVLSYGQLILGIVPLEQVLAFLLGLVTFVAAEVAAECFVTWIAGEPPARGLLRHVLRRRERRAAEGPRQRRGRYERAAGVASLVIVSAMLGVLGWLVVVRDQNVKAAREITAGAVGPTPGSVLPGLPGGANGAVAPVAAGAPAPASPSGAAPAGPITFGAGAGGPLPAGPGAAPAPNATEPSVGPVGALSMVVFLLAFVAAALANSTHEYTRWRRTARGLAKQLAKVRDAREASERELNRAVRRTPHGSTKYDTAARLAVNLADECLQRAQGWEGRVRELYPVYCRRMRMTPVGLAFPALPSLPDETERLLHPHLRDGQQVGGYGVGTIRPERLAPVPPGVAPAGPAFGDDVPPAAPAPGQHGVTVDAEPQPGPSEDRDEAQAERADRGAVRESVAEAIERMRAAGGASGAEPRRGRRRRRDEAGGPAATSRTSPRTPKERR